MQWFGHVKRNDISKTPKSAMKFKSWRWYTGPDMVQWLILVTCLPQSATQGGQEIQSTNPDQDGLPK